MIQYDAEIEYLQSTGTQYINTGIKAETYTYYYKGYLNNNTNQVAFGAGSTAVLGLWAGGYVGLQYGSNKQYYAASSSGISYVKNGLNEIFVTPNYIEVNGRKYNYDKTYTISSNNIVCLFSDINNNYRFKNRIYNFKIINDNAVLLDLIPVRIGSVGYMYDKVSDKLFGNAGTGSFILGPDTKLITNTGRRTSKLRRRIFERIRKEPELPYDHELEYIRSLGTGQIINLDVTPDLLTDAVEVDVQQIANKTQGRFANSGKLDLYVNGSNTFSFNRYTGGDSWQVVLNQAVGTVRRKYKVDYLNKQAFVDDYLRYTITGTLTNPATIPSQVTLFGYSTGSGNLNAKIFGAKYWKNGELIRDLIPVEKNGEAAMYDKITGQMYYNAGTGEFELGRIRYKNESDYVLPDYVMCEGSLLDTRIIPDGNTRIILDMWHRPVIYEGNYHEILGTRNAYKNNDFSFDSLSWDSGSYFEPRDVYGNNEFHPGCTHMNLMRVVLEKNKGYTNITGVYEDIGSDFSKTRTNQNFHPTSPMYLGGWNQNNTSYPIKTNDSAIFGFKIYNNDIVQRSYIPAIHPDGTVGFFDQVSKSFYESNNLSPYRAGYVHTSTEGYKFVFYNTGISDNLGYLRNDSDLLSSLIPIKTRQIKIKKDPNYTTKVIEYGCRRIIKKGNENIISSESDGDIIEVSPDCNHIAILVENCPLNYNPQVDVVNVGTPNYLCFTALEDGTFTFTIGYALSTEHLQYIEYSIDGGNTWVRTNNRNASTVTITTPTISANNKVLWRGSGVRTISNTYASYISTFSSSGNFDISGNIASLLYGDNIEKGDLHPDTSQNIHVFGSLFKNATKLIHSHELCLPFFYLRNYEYYEMFSGCTSLVSTPKLNSSKLADYCYSYMFSGCTSLTELPYLPAKYLANRCYNNMFSNCTSLTTLTDIFPTFNNLVSQYSMSWMFAGCTNLQDASAITINLLNQTGTCGHMFANCTSLILPPILSATAQSTYSCEYMFENCTSLVNPPELPATTLGASCYQYMFSGCTSLNNIPNLSASTLQNYCYQYMFNNCTSLTNVTLTMHQPQQSSYAQMFNGCTSLEVFTGNLTTSLPAVGAYKEMFKDCTSLITGPNEIQALKSADYAYEGMFDGCTNLEDAPILYATILSTGCYKNMFRNCSKLSYIDCKAVNMTATDCLSGWVSGVATNGTFIQRSDATWTTGINGIPTNWIIKYLNVDNGKYYNDSSFTSEWENAPVVNYTSKIEYLQNYNSTARINTRLDRTNVNKIEVKFYYDSRVNYAKIFSNYNTNNHNAILLDLATTDNTIRTQFDTKHSGGLLTFTANSGEIHTLIIEKATSVTLDGITTEITNNTNGTTNNNVISLFSSNVSSTTVYKSNIRIYEFKAWSNGVLQEHLIPIRIDNVGAMYDLTSGRIFNNTQSGTFILGPDIT